MCFTTISDAVRVTIRRYFDGRGRRIISAGGQLDGGSSTSKDSSTRDHRRGGTGRRRLTIAGEQLDVGSSTSKDSSTRDHRRGGTAGQRVINADGQLDGGSSTSMYSSTRTSSSEVVDIIVGGAAESRISSSEEPWTDHPRRHK